MDAHVCPTSPAEAGLTHFNGAALGPAAQDVFQVEAVAEADGEDPWVEINVAPHIRAAERRVVVPGHLGVEPRLLDVAVEIPAPAEGDINARLQREADRVVYVDARGAKQVVAPALAEVVG